MHHGFIWSFIYRWLLLFSSKQNIFVCNRNVQESFLLFIKLTINSFDYCYSSDLNILIYYDAAYTIKCVRLGKLLFQILNPIILLMNDNLYWVLTIRIRFSLFLCF